MKSDRELLELAAKAAGLKIRGFSPIGGAVLDEYHEICWKPLTDDGDAMRLAVKLGMSVCVDNEGGLTRIRDEYMEVFLVCRHEPRGADAATRLAIVRAAAAIGEAM